MGTEYIQCKEGDLLNVGDIVYTAHTPITRMAEVVAGPGQLGSACVVKYSDTGAWNVLPVTYLQKKREMVKREGWINIYPPQDESGLSVVVSLAFPSEEIANCHAMHSRTACVRIEWEEPA